MYGLDHSIDLSFLKSREVDQVAVGLYQVVFGFDEDVRISVQSEFIYFDGQREWLWKPERGALQTASQALSLLGATIEGFKGDRDGTLELTFSNGSRVTILIRARSTSRTTSHDRGRPSLSSSLLPRTVDTHQNWARPGL
jgi:hypothetical protein